LHVEASQQAPVLHAPPASQPIVQLEWAQKSFCPWHESGPEQRMVLASAVLVTPVLHVPLPPHVTRHVSPEQVIVSPWQTFPVGQSMVQLVCDAQ
jgi:hypothetical protein